MDPAYVEPQRGLSNMDPAYVDPAPYVGSPTWTLLMWTPQPQRGLSYVDPSMWRPLRGLSYVDPAYVDPPTWIPLRGLAPLHGWFPKRLFPKWCTDRNSVGAGF